MISQDFSQRYDLDVPLREALDQIMDIIEMIPEYDDQRKVYRRRAREAVGG